MARMRTIDAAMTLIREVDRGTSLTKYALRRMVLSGEIPSVVVGKNKRLINVDMLLERLANPEEWTQVEPLPGIIRPVDERARFVPHTPMDARN